MLALRQEASSAVVVLLVCIVVVTRYYHAGAALSILSPSSNRIPSHSMRRQQSSSRCCSSSLWNSLRDNNGDELKNGAAPDKHDLDDVRRIFCISDLHTDNVDNLAWLRDQVNSPDDELLLPSRATDVLIVAGDISHELSTLQTTLEILLSLQCHVFFIPGNHEAWIYGAEMDGLGLETSLEKLEKVQDLCDALGVHTRHELVGGSHDHPAWIVPIQGWYDGSLSLPHCEDYCANFQWWPWTDFVRCQWTDAYPPSENVETARIPVGLADYFLQLNQVPLQEVQNQIQSNEGLVTFSHFLPNQQCLPDWKDLTVHDFSVEWLDHGAPEVSAKFAKVAGCAGMDKQLRSLGKHVVEKTNHVHVFGHSHRPKDFLYQNIRYVHNPLGKPRERELHVISPQVNFQLLWDTTKKGQVPGEQVLRYWDEKAGGIDKLRKRLKPHLARRRRRAQRVAKKKNMAESATQAGRIRK